MDVRPSAAGRARVPAEWHPRTTLIETGDDAGMFLRCDVPAAAFLAPRALDWARGASVPVGQEEAYARCLTSWRAAGLALPDGGPGAGPAVPAWLRYVGVPHPVLVVAMAADCTFCRQLRADLAANHAAVRRLPASVLLVDGDTVTALGKPLESRLFAELPRAGADIRPFGTPSAVRLRPYAEPVLLRGFDQVTAALVEAGGLPPGRVVSEAPSSCSAGVAAAPVDALITARAGGRLIGVAARGEEAAAVAARCARAAEGDAYVPVTLLVERPERLFLLYRGGELAARLRTERQAYEVLQRLVTGFAGQGSGSGSGPAVLLCGAVVHEDGRALLFPRHWMTHLVTHGSRLARAGWHVRPDPFVRLRPGPSGPLLADAVPVTGVLAERARGLGPGPHARERLLTHAVNWAARPTAPGAVRQLVGLVGVLPFHIGTRDEALAFLTGR
ncbi:hypothetical protein [Streptomyces sp. UNOC14_S4]|uniref:hypothetical protein n=1 Tax=Streptomyces sp. UNOC14_S4 TaxID=2872340 RepID=UPI001E615B35|nr:hypothetical protein [Streptomyces sp. UNOC14_S4]MCC3767798.1 hypothetical protein [Streptomyces sp. UNOC14_S4]